MANERKTKMKKIVFVLAVLITFASFGVSDKLVNKLIKVESNGNHLAVGDNGKAVGVLQIHPEMVADINRFAKRRFTLADRKDRKKSIEMCKLYLAHYGSRKRLGHAPTEKELARIWNGGPNGHRKTATLKYWEKVKKA